jgi:hypothetical protein
MNWTPARRLWVGRRRVDPARPSSQRGNVADLLRDEGFGLQANTKTAGTRALPWSDLTDAVRRCR